MTFILNIKTMTHRITLVSQLNPLNLQPESWTLLILIIVYLIIWPQKYTLIKLSSNQILRYLFETIIDSKPK
jgi:hypothetical protein